MAEILQYKFKEGNSANIGCMTDLRTISIDFGVCQPKNERVFITYGSFAYEITGGQGDVCNFRYGGEVENPNWGEDLTTKCQVPKSVGTRRFEVKDLGVNFSPISAYCSEPPLNTLNLYPLVIVAYFVVGAIVFFVGYRLFGAKIKKLLKLN